MADTNHEVLRKIGELYQHLYEHDGFGEMTVQMRILKRNQKEVIVRCGCEHRFVVDWKNGPAVPKNRTNLEQQAGAGPEAPGIKPCSECSS